MIYFVRCQKAVKIGYTKNVVKRFGELQSANHTELELLTAIPGTLGTEALFHEVLKDSRIRGEWFHLGKGSQIRKIVFLLNCGIRPKTLEDVKALYHFDLSKGSSYGPSINYGAVFEIDLPPAKPGIDVEKRDAAIRDRQLKRLGLTSPK